MNARMLYPLALLLAACPGKTTPTGDTETTTPEPEETGPTGTEPEVDLDFPARYVFMSADFGFDSGAKSGVPSIINPTVYGFEVVNRVQWVVGTQAWLSSPDPYADTDEYCTIDLVFPEGPAAFSPTAQADLTVYFGVDHSNTAADVITNCNDKDHNIEDLFGPDVADYMIGNAEGPWAMAIGQLSENMIDIFEDNNLTTEDWDGVVGARVYNSSFYWPGIIGDDEWYALPIVLDAKFEAQIDGNYYVTVPAEDVWSGSSLATAWYRISTWFGVDLGQTF